MRGQSFGSRAVCNTLSTTTRRDSTSKKLRKETGKQWRGERLGVSKRTFPETARCFSAWTEPLRGIPLRAQERCSSYQSKPVPRSSWKRRRITTGNVIALCGLRTPPVPVSERRLAPDDVRPAPRQSPRGARHSGEERKRSRRGSPKEARAAGVSLRQAV